jgi:homoserine acetyltransferase
LADGCTALSGEDCITGDKVGWFWRLAGIIPFASELRKGFRTVDAGLDATRKVHGVLPGAQDLANYGVEDLARLRNELQTSVQTRIEKTVELGADYGHNARLAEEQQLIQSIDKHLKDR